MSRPGSGPDHPAHEVHQPGHDEGLLPEQDHHHSRRRLRGCLPVLVAFALIAAAVLIGGRWALDRVGDRLESAPDYPGPGHGQVMYEVKEGATSVDIGRDLKREGVVKSVDAFTTAANQNEESRNIQVGFYRLKKQMKATDALGVLVDPTNRVGDMVTVPEGLRAVDVVTLLAKETDFSRAELMRALRDDAALGLPSYARGNAEGYLFPATYEVQPKETAASLLRAMVDRWRQAAEDVGLEAGARRLGYSPAQVMTVASLVEAEGRGGDMPKIARVLYNRLETKGPPTFGKLEVDATINYALDRRLGVALSPRDLNVNSPYNTRKNAGLPPGPIEAPGEEAMRAALEPAEGDWLFYVTVNLRTGETRFADTYKEFLRYKAEYQKYCETSKAC